MGGFKTLGDLQDDSQDEDNSLFVGGGKNSGLAVNPPTNASANDVYESLARRNAGSLRDDTNVITRHLTLFSNGFVIEPETHLRPYSDNQLLLKSILEGRAPMDILQVPFEAEVDLQILKKTEEEYSEDKLPGEKRKFKGSGQALGLSSAPSANPKINESKETKDVKVSVKLFDGSRVSSIFKSSDTMAGVYSYVASMSQRPFVLERCYPREEFRDLTMLIAEADIGQTLLVQKSSE